MRIALIRLALELLLTVANIDTPIELEQDIDHEINHCDTTLTHSSILSFCQDGANFSLYFSHSTIVQIESFLQSINGG